MTPLTAELLARCHFPAPGKPIACAVSGGADSLALLVLATAAGCVPTAFHVDHGLRPESSAESAVVRAAADLLGCGFVALAVSCEPGPNLEARARAARFAVLPENVATGHTADDQAETVLLNLMRGSGPSGAGAMEPGVRHPILELRRFETEGVVAERGLTVVYDPSNDDPSIRRNRVRHEVVPLLSEIAARDVVPLIARFAAIARADAALLDQFADEVDLTSVEALRAAPLAVRRRAIRHLVTDGSPMSYPPDYATVERVLAVVDGSVTGCEIGGGYRVRRSAGHLVIVAPSSDPGDVR